MVADDLPTASWGEDWTELLDSIDAYARALEQGGEAELVVPLTPDGYSIVDRMDRAEPGGCAVPDVLSELDSPAPPLT